MDVILCKIVVAHKKERARETRRLELALLGNVCCKVDVLTLHVPKEVRKIKKIFI